MKWKKTAALGCAIALSAALITGCGDNTATAQDAKTVSQEENTQQESRTVMAQVTSVDGNTITATIGTLSTREMGEKPEGEAPEGTEMPEGEAPKGEAPEGEAPEGETPEGEAPEGMPPEGAPEGEAPEGTEMPEGEAPEGMSERGTPRGDAFTAGDETITVTITDDTVITVQDMQGEQDATMDDIAQDSVLEITLDEASGEAISIIVKNMGAGVE